MRISNLPIALACLSVTTAVAAHETPECQIRVLRPVTDEMGNHWKPGQLLPVTSIQRDKNGVSFCAHGGSCVPRMASGGQAAQLVNCRPGKPLGDGYLGVAPDPQKMSAATFRQMNAKTEAEAKLSAMGLSNATTGSFAEAYASAPNSANGRLAARAIAGSPQAQAALKKQDGQ
jgi:hypothetical protein